MFFCTFPYVSRRTMNCVNGLVGCSGGQIVIAIHVLDSLGWLHICRQHLGTWSYLCCRIGIYNLEKSLVIVCQKIPSFTVESVEFLRGLRCVSAMVHGRSWAARVCHIWLIGSPQKIPLHYQDPRASAKTIFFGQPKCLQGCAMTGSWFCSGNILMHVVDGWNCRFLIL